MGFKPEPSLEKNIIPDPHDTRQLFVNRKLNNWCRRSDFLAAVFVSAATVFPDEPRSPAPPLTWDVNRCTSKQPYYPAGPPYTRPDAPLLHARLFFFCREICQSPANCPEWRFIPVYILFSCVWVFRVCVCVYVCALIGVSLRRSVAKCASLQCVELEHK